MKFGIKALITSVAMVSGMGQAMAADIPLPFPGTITGNIGVYSSYNLRGITTAPWGPENDNAAIQGGLDYTHPSGVYLGWWMSNLGYSYAGLNPDCTGGKCTRKSIENDFYGGYKGKINDDLSYQIGGTIYYYTPGWHSNGYETMLGLTYKGVSLTAQTLLNDVTFGNKGDTYFLASYYPTLPAGFTGKMQVGAYLYGKDDKYLGTTTEDFAFRHATLGLSHPLGNTGATWSFDYIFGGYARDDSKQKNKAVLGLSYAF